MVHLDNNLRFVANFKYQLKPNVTTDPVHSKVNFDKLITDIDEETKWQFDSNCGQTMIGFVQNLNNTHTMAQHEVICFYGEKDKTKLYED